MSKLTEKLTRKYNSAKMTIIKHSPEILVAAGITGTVAATVLACRATLQIETVLAERNETIEKIKSVREDESIPEEKYSQEDMNKDLQLIKVQTAVKIAKLYAPAVVLGALSISMIIKSHDILNKRNIGLAAAYAGVDQAFNDYRERVKERFGEEVERELHYDIRKEEVEHENEDGTTTNKTVEVMDNDPSRYSPYARFFDSSSGAWDKDPEYNLLFLKKQQDSANDMLKARGYLFLNDVYRMVGLQPSKAGQIVGWVYDEENPIGDNYVDFGIYDLHSSITRDFVNGFENVILLDFNVDGNILDLI